MEKIIKKVKKNPQNAWACDNITHASSVYILFQSCFNRNIITFDQIVFVRFFLHLQLEIANAIPANTSACRVKILKVIYHPLYGMNNYVLIWGDWLSCDPLRGSHDSQSPHIWGDRLSCDSLRGSHNSQSPHIRKHLCPILWQL